MKMKAAELFPCEMEYTDEWLYLHCIVNHGKLDSLVIRNSSLESSTGTATLDTCNSTRDRVFHDDVTVQCPVTSNGFQIPTVVPKSTYSLLLRFHEMSAEGSLFRYMIYS